MRGVVRHMREQDQRRGTESLWHYRVSVCVMLHLHLPGRNNVVLQRVLYH